MKILHTLLQYTGSFYFQNVRNFDIHLSQLNCPIIDLKRSVYGHIKQFFSCWQDLQLQIFLDDDLQKSTKLIALISSFLHCHFIANEKCTIPIKDFAISQLLEGHGLRNTVVSIVTNNGKLNHLKKGKKLDIFTWINYYRCNNYVDN